MGYRKYFNGSEGKHPKGLFAGGSAGLNYIDGDYEPVAGIKGDASGVVLLVTGEAGYRWIFSDNLFASAALELGYYMGNISSEVTIGGVTYKSDLPQLGIELDANFGLGYAW